METEVATVKGWWAIRFKYNGKEKTLKLFGATFDREGNEKAARQMAQDQLRSISNPQNPHLVWLEQRNDKAEPHETYAEPLYEASTTINKEVKA